MPAQACKTVFFSGPITNLFSILLSVLTEILSCQCEKENKKAYRLKFRTFMCRFQWYHGSEGVNSRSESYTCVLIYLGSKPGEIIPHIFYSNVCLNFLYCKSFTSTDLFVLSLWLTLCKSLFELPYESGLISYSMRDPYKSKTKTKESGSDCS